MVHELIDRTVKAEHINPFLSAAVDVFSTMLNCQLQRGPLALGANFQPAHEISGVISLSGKASGTVVFSVEREVALCVAEQMLGERPASLNAEVADAIGEVTNMIAGRAKAGLEHLEMRLGLPRVVVGRNHTIDFGSVLRKISIPYVCPWGELTVDVGLLERIDETQSEIRFNFANA